MAKREGQGQSLADSFKCAFEGIRVASKERNFRIELCFAVAAIVLNIVFDIDAAGWMAVVICIATVLSLEACNTALESVVDLVTRENHPLARIAKDCAAGAVLIASIGSLYIAIQLYLPPFIAMLH